MKTAPVKSQPQQPVKAQPVQQPVKVVAQPAQQPPPQSTQPAPQGTQGPPQQIAPKKVMGVSIMPFGGPPQKAVVPKPAQVFLF